MKTNKFTLGAIAGISAVALAIPILAQVSSAATPTGSTSSTTRTFTRPIPTQAQVQTMATNDDSFLKNVDAFVTVEKTAVQAHETALTAAASITDDTQRQAAVQKANTDERTAIQAAITANPSLKSAMMPFGGPMMGGARGGAGRQGPNMSAALATKLGITAAQLQTELASGKTIQQIATEHGVTLPTPPTGGSGHGKHGGWMGHGPSTGTTSSTTTSAQ